VTAGHPACEKLAPAIPRDSCWEDLWTTGLSWGNLWKKRPVAKENMKYRQLFYQSVVQLVWLVLTNSVEEFHLTVLVFAPLLNAILHVLYFALQCFDTVG